MYDGELMDMYQTILYYDHENSYCSHLVKWNKLTPEQMNILIDLYSKEHDILVSIIHEQSND